MLFKTAALALSSLGFQPNQDTELIRKFNKNFINRVDNNKVNSNFSVFYSGLGQKQKDRVKKLLKRMKLTLKPNLNQMLEKIETYEREMLSLHAKVSMERVAHNLNQSLNT